MAASQRLHRGALIVAALVIAATFLGLRAEGVFDRPEHASIDARFRVRGTQAPPRDVVVVAISDETLVRLGRQWPYPRSWHGEVARTLANAGARAVGYDVVFAEPSSAPAEDDALWAALRRSRAVVAVAEWNGRRPAFFRADELAGSGVAAANVAWSTDAAFRRLEPELGGVPSFPLALARAAGRHPSDAGVWVDYAGGPGTVRTIPFEDVLDNRFDRALVRGRVVIVGATASRLGDLHATPFGGGLMPGPEVNAHATATLLAGDPLRGLPGAATIALMLALIAGLTAAAWRASALATAVATIALTALLVVAAQLAFAAGVVVELVAPLTATLVTGVAALAISAATVGRERRRLRVALGRFLPAPVVSELVAASDLQPGIAPRRTYATILFADLRGFTAIAERLPPERVIELLDRWLAEVADAVLDAGGTLVSFQGDGVMAVFGAPLEQVDHADRALDAAGAVLGPGVERVVAWAAEQGLADGLGAGAGVASGPVMCGTVGSRRRLEYAAIGDTTNTAARLQSMTREHGHPLLIADATRAALTRQVELEPVGALDVRGHSVPAAVWTLAPHDREGAG